MRKPPTPASSQGVRRARRWPVAAGLLLCWNAALAAQVSEDDALSGDGPPPEWTMTPSYPDRKTDPAAVERGRMLYELNGCSFCHGKDTRGGDGGPSLLRSQLVLSDQQGEQISKVVLNGVANTNMVAFALKGNEIEDLAEFLHSFKVSGDDAARRPPPSIVTGDAAAGAQFFAAHCSSCHDAAGDLHNIAARYPIPRRLQQRWLMPHSGAITEVTVHPAHGAAVRGVLLSIDEFMVSLRRPDGTPRSFERRGELPRVELLDPLAGHKALLSVYRDADIHNVTAYLVTLK